MSLLLVSIVNATCTPTLDKTDYIPLETATVQVSCDTPQERGQAYTITWNNGTADIETDTGTTPSTTGANFFETLVIPIGSNWTNANVTLTGTLLEGTDSFNVTGGQETDVIKVTNFIKDNYQWVMGLIIALIFIVFLIIFSNRGEEE